MSCGGILPSRTMNMNMVTRAQARDLKDLEQIENITGLKDVNGTMGKLYVDPPLVDMTRINPVLQDLPMLDPALSGDLRNSTGGGYSVSLSPNQQQWT